MGDPESVILREKKRKEALRAKEKARADAVKNAMQCFSTEAGKYMLRWIMQECGFHKPSVIYNAESGDIKLDATVYNEAKRDIYLRIRSLLVHDPKLLAEIENHIKES